jgi:hypothetical protein
MRAGPAFLLCVWVALVYAACGGNVVVDGNGGSGTGGGTTTHHSTVTGAGAGTTTQCGLGCCATPSGCVCGCGG